MWLPPSKFNNRISPLKDFEFISDYNSCKDFKEQVSIIHEQVRSEILERIRIGDLWFRYKFLILGGLIGGALGVMGTSKILEKKFNSMDDFLISRELTLILSLCAVVSILIDIYVRRNELIIN